MSTVPTSASGSTLPRKEFNNSSSPAHGAPSSSGDSSRSRTLNPLAREFVPAEDGLASKNSQSEGAATSKSPRHTEPEKDGGVKETFANQQAGSGSETAQSHVGGLTSVLKGTPGAQHVSQPSGRRGHWNANHLLNFQYDPIARSHPRPSPRRPQQRVQAFDKELFLQANFRFLVSDFGNYLENNTDPDKMVKWEDIALVELSSSVPVQCPICLESPPLCPQITSCGHVFCFPCILRYYTSGGSENRSDYWRTCPLCFAMTSLKELRTAYIHSVEQIKVGEGISFTLLTRAKGSVIPLQSNEGWGSPAYSKDGRCHPYSKFTLTSDIEKTTDDGIAELISWAERAESGDSEDLENVPYVFGAIDQLKLRKAAWEEHRTLEFLSSSPPVRKRLMAQAKAGLTKLPMVAGEATGENVQESPRTVPKKGPQYRINPFTDEREVVVSPPESVNSLHHLPDDWESFPEKSGSPPKHEETDSYTFYQSADGQLIIIHPLSMRCLLHHYGSFKSLPLRLEAKVFELETVVQTDVTRKRYRYLSHLPLTSIFQLCEVDVSELLPRSALAPFREELNARKTRRQRKQKQERMMKSAEERAEEKQVPPSPEDFIAIMNVLRDNEVPTAVDFADSLVSTPAPVVSPPADDRKLFSRVAKLGFAAGHDAPDLVNRGGPSNTVTTSKETTGTAEAGASSRTVLSFADVIQRQKEKEKEKETPVAKGSKNKGKKPQVLLSTAGGRRY